MFKPNERGLTLIEIAVALAIAGILAATVLTGRDQLRAQLQFSESVDQAVQALTSARGEATGAVGSTLSGGGTGAVGACGSGSCVIMGKLIKFTNGSGIIQVSTVLENQTSQTIFNTGYNTYNVTLPWGVTATGATTYIFFYQDSVGQFHVSTDTNPPASVSPVPIAGPATIALGDPATHSATISVDPQGDVTRVIN